MKIDIFHNFMTSSKGGCSMICFVKIALSVIMVMKKMHISTENQNKVQLPSSRDLLSVDYLHSFMMALSHCLLTTST